MSNLTDGDLVSQLMVVCDECDETLDQFRLVTTEFELRAGADVFVQTFDKQLELGDEKGGNDAPSDGLLNPKVGWHTRRGRKERRRVRNQKQSKKDKREWF